MNIRGSRTLDAPRSAVFDAIMDPDVLLAVIPGCDEIERIDDAEFHGRISLRLPGVVGTYRTVVRVAEADRPSAGTLEGTVVGTLGTIEGHATFRLTDADGRTTVDYDGTATIGGPLARLDSRFVEGLAGSLVGQGLDRLDARLQIDRTSGAAAADPAVSGEARR